MAEASTGGRLSPAVLSMMESVDYRRSMRGFLRAAGADPDLLIDVDLPEAAVVLDIGAFRGEWARRILKRAVERGPATLHIHAFEPAPGAIDDFQAECADDPNVALHPYGLAGRDRKESMSVSGAGSSVFLDPGDPRTMGVCEIKLRDVDSALAGLGPAGWCPGGGGRARRVLPVPAR